MTTETRKPIRPLKSPGKSASTIQAQGSVAMSRSDKKPQALPRTPTRSQLIAYLRYGLDDAVKVSKTTAYFLTLAIETLERETASPAEVIDLKEGMRKPH